LVLAHAEDLQLSPHGVAYNKEFRLSFALIIDKKTKAHVGGLWVFLYIYIISLWYVLAPSSPLHINELFFHEGRTVVIKHCA
jgi:hypothetical protein